MGCSPSSGDRRSFRIMQDETAVQNFHDQYLLGPRLGRGSSAQVHTATSSKSSPSTQNLEEWAVKILSVRGKYVTTVASQRRHNAVMLETDLWSAVGQHVNCVRLHEVFHGASICYMVMERCKSGLLDHLQQMPQLTEATIGPIFAQMLQGLAHVHSARIVHRDVKPDNFLIGGADGQTVKLCDFGISGRLPEEGKLWEVAGRAPFLSPEMLCNCGYNDKADVWSVGVIAYALLFGTFPFMPATPSNRLMKLAIIDGAPPKFAPTGRSLTKDAQFRTESAVDFVRTLMERDPDQRPVASEALNMEYMLAVAGNRHAHGDDLPSLLPMLQLAKNAGAFERFEMSMDTEVDSLLNILQMDKHGVPVPRPTLLTANDAGAKIRKEKRSARTNKSGQTKVVTHDTVSVSENISNISDYSTNCTVSEQSATSTQQDLSESRPIGRPASMREDFSIGDDADVTPPPPSCDHVPSSAESGVAQMPSIEVSACNSGPLWI